MKNSIPQDLMKGWTVVVADDELDSLEIASLILRFYGADVIECADGREALEAVRKHHPRFVISDLSMPRMDGWGLIYQLKLERATLEIPVIALTAHAMTGDRQRAIAAGFHNYLTKPLTVETFMTDLLFILIEIPELALLLKEK
ncbi:MAG: response regulator [Chloroflexota bacterium]|nr:response regulator [Chloroflexota bacterium]